jgi:hypothetical protein
VVKVVAVAVVVVAAAPQGTGVLASTLWRCPSIADAMHPAKTSQSQICLLWFVHGHVGACSRRLRSCPCLQLALTSVHISASFGPVNDPSHGAEAFYLPACCLEVPLMPLPVRFCPAPRAEAFQLTGLCLELPSWLVHH